MDRLRGCTYFYLWYSSILAGYAGLFCPILPVLFVSNQFYRYLTDVFLTFWQTYPTALMELLCGCQVQVLGDPIRAGETSILIMNHRTRTDWNFLWPGVYHCTTGPGRYKHSTKFILKDIIRHIPGIGWVMQLACFIYIKRNWLKDRSIVEKTLKYFCDISYKYTLLIFPEGTDLTTNTKRNSDLYAEENKLVKYEHVLHPRTTGFAFITSRLLQNQILDAVYDVTAVYPDRVPQTEKILFFDGEFPKEVKMHFTRYPASILPKNQIDLKHFLEKRWKEKEQVLAEFHSTGHFLHGQLIRRSFPMELYVSFIFWTLLPYVVLYFLYTSFHFRLLILIHTLFLLILNLISADGFPMFEVHLFRFKQLLFDS